MSISAKDIFARFCLSKKLSYKADISHFDIYIPQNTIFTASPQIILDFFVGICNNVMNYFMPKGWY